MNLVLITSVIHTSSQNSVFNSQERLYQLINNTIKSVKSKIPNSYIVILEGSNLSLEEKYILENYCNELICFNVNGMEKSVGELYLIRQYLLSEKFKNIKINIENLIKISGRYSLLDDFEFSKYKSSVIKNIKSSWTDYFVSVTLYYKIQKNDIEYFISKIFDIDSIFIDLEHTFYKFKIVPCDYSIGKIGVGGYLSPNGEYIEDGVYLN